ncbi:outer membrane beta-barrel protein [Paucibacter sp. AS339]|uniref:outer membrane beta-barrel protein n=1 Tax=Paucibacter hankyongi TaxID=3133434 RepID=UPI003097FF20
MSKFKVMSRTLAATLTGAFALAVTAGSASAAPQAESYVGANVGVYNKYDSKCSSGQKCDQTASLGGKIYGGINYENFGVEVMAFGAGKGEGTLRQAGQDAQGSVKIGGLGVVGTLPLQLGDVTLKGKLGAAYTRGVANYTAGGSESKNSFGLLGGAGLSYALSKTLSVNADYDYLSAKYNKAGDKASVNMFSLGLSYKF